MNIEVFKNESKVGSYIKQKGPYDWDYTTLPPKNKHVPIVWGWKAMCIWATQVALKSYINFL